MHALFEPWTLGPATIRNRMIKAATFEGRAPDALVTDELVDFHLDVANGGIGMTTVAYLAVSPEGRTDRHQIWLRDEARAGLERLTAAVHQTGASISAQIGHAGPVANSRSNGAQGFAPSSMFNPLAAQRMVAPDVSQIKRIIADFGAGAAMVADVGFDVVEIHLGHDYLPSAFMSRALNRRKDEWGGSLENRARFAREIVAAVRERVGSDIAVIAKFGMDHGYPGGMWVRDALRVAQMLEDDGGLDALVLTAGSSLANPMYLFRGDAPVYEFAKTLPPWMRAPFKVVGGQFLKTYPYEEAFLAPMARQFLDALDTPVVLLGGISELETATAGIDEGFAAVAMARALLREPNLPNRWAQGSDTPSLCIHCNKCMPTIYEGTNCVLV